MFSHVHLFVKLRSYMVLRLALACPYLSWHPKLAVALQTGHGMSRLALALAPQSARDLYLRIPGPTAQIQSRYKLHFAYTWMHINTQHLLKTNQVRNEVAVSTRERHAIHGVNCPPCSKVGSCPRNWKTARCECSI